MFKTVIVAAAIVGLSASAFAQSIGGGLGFTSLQSGTVGSVSGGGANGGITGLAGITSSQTTQAAGTSGLAGTKLTLDKNGASLVSEHNVSGFAQQTTVGGSLGGAISGGAGLSAFTGTSLSSGSFNGVNGFLGF